LALLQEVFVEAGRDFSLSDRPQTSVAVASSFAYAADGAETGVALMSSSAALLQEPVAHITPDKEPVVGTPKAWLVGEYTLASSGDTLMVATVHGINRASHEAFIDQLERLAAVLEKHDGPLLLAGDFNTQSAKKTDFLTTLVTERLGLEPISFRPDGRPLSKLSRRPLDHAFVRGASRVCNTRTHTDVRGSDHVAMTFVLEFALSTRVGRVGRGRAGSGTLHTAFSTTSITS
jgi:endonuclease/exonuclease/phosphatase (EEP) superfamily protein YafD